jgi:hypothetical protein
MDQGERRPTVPARFEEAPMSAECPKSLARKATIPRSTGGDVSELPSDLTPLHHQLAQRLGYLPKDLAVTLISLGFVGVAIPGPVPPGPSFILLGAVILWPGLLVKTGGPLARRFPGVFRMLIHFADHLHSDLARRYPRSRRA